MCHAVAKLKVDGAGNAILAVEVSGPIQAIWAGVFPTDREMELHSWDYDDLSATRLVDVLECEARLLFGPRRTQACPST
jgi:hypothetical protein